MRIEWIRDNTYRHTKPHVRDEETKYPCIYNISKATGELKLKYSDSDLGHFGTPKVCFGIGQRAGIPFVDAEGKYGLSQYVMGIVDEPEVLPYIAKAMDSIKFRNTMALVQFTTCEWDRNIIKMFRKDFWKEFV